MPISDSEWASILAAAEKVARKVTSQRGDFITGRVIKRDEVNGLVWLHEFGDQPIPVVGHGVDVKYYTEAPSVAVPTRQIFTTGSGTYTTPAGVLFIRVRCIGGGGGSGGVDWNSAAAAASGGAGGGAYAESLISSPSATYAYVVGAGGTAGARSASGGNGGDTTFGSTLVVAKGGSASAGMNAVTTPTLSQGGYGGLASASTGDFKLDGGDGGFGIVFSSSFAAGGMGGEAARGGGQSMPPSASSAAAQAGNSPGGGASGAHVITSTFENGAVGGSGLIVVDEFYGGSSVQAKKAKSNPDVPAVGDSVLIALEMGSRGLPRCLGVIRNDSWIIPEDET